MDKYPPSPLAKDIAEAKQKYDDFIQAEFMKRKDREFICKYVYALKPPDVGIIRHWFLEVTRVVDDEAVLQYGLSTIAAYYDVLLEEGKSMQLQIEIQRTQPIEIRKNIHSRHYLYSINSNNEMKLYH